MDSLPMQLKVVCNLCLSHRLLGAFPNLLYSIFDLPLACQSSWRTIICTAFCNGKKHDFRLFKESKTHIHSTIAILTDTGYQGLQKIHFKTQMPKKRSKKNPLTQEDRKNNQKLSKERVLNENVIGNLKRFKIICDRYRNRRKRFSLRFNLIAGIYNLELIE
jgi:hypothetical protein